MNVFVVSILKQQERKSNMGIRNELIGSRFGEPGAHPYQEFPGISPLPWGLKRGRKETKTLCSSRGAIFSIMQPVNFF